MTCFIIMLRVCWDIWFGYSLLRMARSDRSCGETVLASLLLGFYVETMLTGSLVFLGVPFHWAVGATLTFGTLVSAVLGWLAPPLPSLLPGWKPCSYEWLFMIVLSMHMLHAIWMLSITPLYFDDAVTHWAGRARALYGEVNWSLNPASPAFMGIRGADHYPLGVPIWRATTAFLNGSWTDVVARVDCLVFLLASILTVWTAVRRLSGNRWLGVAMAFVLGTLPLQAWHATSGYADIAVQAFAVAALAALLRREFLLGGMFAAGTAWMKNDGLVIYIPALFVAAFLLARSTEAGARVYSWQRLVVQFGMGIATLAPWLLAKWRLGLGVAPNDESIAFHPESWRLLWERVVLGPAHGVFWPCFFLIVLWGLPPLLRSSQGRAVLLCFLTSASAVVFVFTATGAFQFLHDETTVHRSVLQLYGMAMLLLGYAISLRLPTRSNNATH